MKRTFLTAHDIACMPIFFELTRIHFKEVYDSKTKDQNSAHKCVRMQLEQVMVIWRLRY